MLPSAGIQLFTHPLMFTCVTVFGTIWICVSRLEISFSGLGPDRGRCSIRNIADKLRLQIYLNSIALEVAFRSKSASDFCCAHKRPIFFHTVVLDIMCAAEHAVSWKFQDLLVYII